LLTHSITTTYVDTDTTIPFVLGGTYILRLLHSTTTTILPGGGSHTTCLPPDGCISTPGGTCILPPVLHPAPVFLIVLNFVRISFYRFCRYRSAIPVWAVLRSTVLECLFGLPLPTVSVLGRSTILPALGTVPLPHRNSTHTCHRPLPVELPPRFVHFYRLPTVVCLPFTWVNFVVRFCSPFVLLLFCDAYVLRYGLPQAVCALHSATVWMPWRCDYLPADYRCCRSAYRFTSDYSPAACCLISLPFLPSTVLPWRGYVTCRHHSCRYHVLPFITVTGWSTVICLFPVGSTCHRYLMRFWRLRHG